MAMFDYGAIAFKNGKLISTGMFTPMKEMVGWTDTEVKTELDGQLDGNYFVYIGDSEITVAFYKGIIAVIRKYSDGTYNFYKEYLMSSNFTWFKWEYFLWEGNVKVTKRNGYYVCKWKYKGNKYKVYFGYGVDFYIYKKYRIVNAYHPVSEPIIYILDRITDFVAKLKRGGNNNGQNR